MPSEPLNSPSETGLIIQRGAGLVTIPNSGSTALSEIVNRSLVHIRTSKMLEIRHRVGEHDLFGPDYSLVCFWAEELRKTPEEVMERLLIGIRGVGSRIVNGRFSDLVVDQEFLPVSGIPPIKGLKVEHLEIPKGFGYVPEMPLTYLDLSTVPELTVLYCYKNNIGELDLSKVPRLKILECWYNPLHALNLTATPNLEKLGCGNCCLDEIDLSCIPLLKSLDCSSNWVFDSEHVGCGFFAENNTITELDLRLVPNLTELYCSGNPLKNLDLQCVPLLKDLCCSATRIKSLDLNPTPHLEWLSCEKTEIDEIDIRGVLNLKVLRYETLDWDNGFPEVRKMRIIQRQDQNFQ